MAIDGPGILASDLAHDVYNEIMDWWDAGVAFDEIRERLHGDDCVVEDRIYAEILLAVCVKAFWEIGQLPPALRDALRAMIDDGASLAAWTEAGDATLARQRKAALERLLKQTATPKARPRPRRKYVVVNDKLYAVGDCLELTAGDRVYRGVVCKIREDRGACEYALLVMHPDTTSTRESFERGHYYGNGAWVPEVSNAGPHVIRLTHRLLVRAGNPFRKVAHVDLDDSRLTYGSFGGVLDMSHVIKDFERTQTSYKAFGQTLLPLGDLIDAEADSST
jgi:hypothetical protein